VEDFKQRVVALHDEHLEICCLAEALIQRMTLANDRQYQRAINLYGTIIKNENLIDKLNDLANRAVELDKNLSEAITRTNEAIELLAQLMDIESAYGNDEIVTFLRDQIDKFQKHHEALQELRNTLLPVKERVEGTLREIRGFRYRYWY